MRGDPQEPEAGKSRRWRLTARMRSVASAMKAADGAPTLPAQAARAPSPVESACGFFMSEEPGIVCELQPLARQLQMPIQEVLLARAIFLRYEQDCCGYMDIADFHDAAVDVLRSENKYDEVVVQRLQAVSAQQQNRECISEISLQEFITWYSVGLNEGLVLTENWRLRELARKHGVSADSVIHLKQCFDASSTDRCGSLVLSEFPQLMQRALKVPANQEFPQSRARSFWTEMGLATAGRLAFDDFVAWWVRYFRDVGPGDEALFEAFYGQVRRIGREHLDPQLPPPHLEAA
mmetsp:Transcript_75886/g.230026  ORF Transcript_75886/g.230026 Transcript_75886/m.230026 type:complete len:292 (-) Transcript_75886:16-891(-)